MSVGGRSLRFGPLLGLAFVVLWIAGQSWPTALPGAPTGAGDDLALFFARNMGAVAAAAILSALGATCLVGFGPVLRVHLAAASGRSAVADAAFASTIVAAALLLLSSAFPLVATGADPFGGETARLLWDLYNASSSLAFLVAIVLVVSVAATARSHGPRWAWLTGFPLAVLLLVPFLWWASAKLFLFWFAALAVSLARGHRWGGAAGPQEAIERPIDTGLGA